jgi:hypothetical protein
MDGASMEMPRYVSHKKVWALKIKAVHAISDGSMVLHFEDQRYGPKGYPIEQHAGRPTPQAGMYFVQYEDGYFSFSPAKAFEEGYTLVTVNGKRPTIAELDSMLNSEDDTPITINPDGSITAK